jgi:hypothetical protein
MKSIFQETAALELFNSVLTCRSINSIVKNSQGEMQHDKQTHWLCKLQEHDGVCRPSPTFMPYYTRTVHKSSHQRTTTELSMYSMLATSVAK